MTNEYSTQAVVLDKEPVGEADAQIYLYTRGLGKVVARATGARKIVSKLNSHLEPLNIAYVRLIEKNRFQMADALKIGQLPSGIIKALALVKDMAPVGEADAGLWSLLMSGVFSEDDVLRVLGFNRTSASCQTCGRRDNLKFSTVNFTYFCNLCYQENWL